MKPFKYISLCSGIEAASVAWTALGWEPVAFAEVEPFPSAVLANRFPDVKNLGDITKVDWKAFHGTADVVISGFPCQSYSVAGLRKGLADPRGQIMLECLAAIRDIDPEWAVLENVPGLLSSHGGRDFQTLLDAVAILWPRGGVAWRILDAQWFGIPQRRRRIFLVINTRDWRRAPAVLFESEGVFGDIASREAKRKELAANAGRGSEGDSGGVTARSEAIAVRTAQTSANGCGVSEGLAHTLDTTGPEAICFKWFQGKASRTMPAYSDGTTPTLTNSDNHVPAICADGGADQSLATGRTSSRPSARQTGTSSSSTTNPSMADVSSSNRRILCVASNHTNAEICEGVSPTVLAHAAKDAPYVVVDANE